MIRVGMLLLSLDVPLDVIRDVLGHASIKTTETHYAHAIVGRQRAAMEKLGTFADAVHQLPAPERKRAA